MIIKLLSGELIGIVDFNSIHFYDIKTLGKEQIINYKITKIKIHIGYLKGKKVISGIESVFENLINGEEKNFINKGKLETEEIIELSIMKNDFLSQVELQFDSDISIFFLRFITHKNHQISFGDYNENKRLIHCINENEIITGFFGYYYKKLNAIGCDYIKRKDYCIYFIFGYLALRHKAKNSEFKNKWDKKFKELDISYQFIWKVANLPDDCKTTFISIFKYIFPY